MRRSRRSEAVGGRRSRPLALYITLIVAIAAAVIAVVVSSALSASKHDARTRKSSVSRKLATRAPAVKHSSPKQETAALAPRRPRRKRRPVPSPGTLPQTSAQPSAHTRTFRREMSELWSAIVLDRPSLARKAFFPKGAYLQLKAIENAGGDYASRLFYDYSLDIKAAHRLLGRRASSAQLIRVEVPPSYAHWVPPEVCYNRDGYYETPNSRMIYREGGHIRSFGIASMISWRGVWYVVHLGAILRSADEGLVDAPSEGAGYAEPSSTC